MLPNIIYGGMHHLEKRLPNGQLQAPGNKNCSILLEVLCIKPIANIDNETKYAVAVKLAL